jgi:hypothetical protein
MMRWLARSVVALLVLAVGVVALQIIASESAEVVVLHARDADGSSAETRLWLADLDGRPYLRAGAAGSSWFGRLSANPEVEVERDGTRVGYLAVPDPDERAALNAAMRAKYGWREAVISLLVGGREAAIPIRLEPR